LALDVEMEYAFEYISGIAVFTVALALVKFEVNNDSVFDVFQMV
jgi:hypothetical protein